MLLLVIDAELDQLEREAIKVGVNWSGAELEGYNVSPASVREALGYWLDKLAKRELVGAAV